MRIRGFTALILAFAALLLIFSIFGLIGSIDTMIRSEYLGLLFIAALILALITILTRKA